MVNGAAIAAGALVGLLIKKGLPQNVEDMAMKMVGLAVSVIGLNGVLSSMLTVSDGKIASDGSILLLVSLVVGGVLGELLRLEERINAFGQKIEKRLGVGGFAKGFVSASLVFSVGAMAIVGALYDGLSGDSSVLLVKSAIDAIAAVVFASSLGVGVVFSAVPVVLYEGAIALGAGFLAPVLEGALLDGICMVGYCIVLCIGTNFLGATKIKTTNLIPALLLPVGYYGLMMLKNL